jgi:hypothetical protein
MAAKTPARKASARKTSTRAKTAGAKASRKTSSRKRATGRRWSQRVTEGSDALDLEGGVFRLKDPKRIAASLKRSAERSRRRKSDPYRSAMSMLTFYVNRAGRTLPAGQKRTLQHAKDELRKQFGRA